MDYAKMREIEEAVYTKKIEQENRPGVSGSFMPGPDHEYFSAKLAVDYFMRTKEVNELVDDKFFGHVLDVIERRSLSDAYDRDVMDREYQRAQERIRKATLDSLSNAYDRDVMDREYQRAQERIRKLEARFADMVMDGDLVTRPSED